MYPSTGSIPTRARMGTGSGVARLRATPKATFPPLLWPVRMNLDQSGLVRSVEGWRERRVARWEWSHEMEAADDVISDVVLASAMRRYI